MASSIALECATTVERAEIDVSRPFESVREAVERFGGSAVWKSQLKQLIHPQKPEHNESTNKAKVEQQNQKVNEEVVGKESETIDILEELESTKKIVEDLKLRYNKEASDVTETLNSSSQNTENESPKDSEIDSPVNSPSAGPEQLSETISGEPTAKVNLNKMVSELAEIRSSIQMLNTKIEKEKLLLEKTREKLVSGTDTKLTCANEPAKNVNKTVEFSEARHVPDSESNSRSFTGKDRETNDDTNKVKSELLMKVEEATEEVKVFTKALEYALRRVEDSANSRKLSNEEVLQVWKSERCQNKPKNATFSGSASNSGFTIGQILSMKKFRRSESEEEGARVCDKENAEPNVSLAQMLDKKKSDECKSAQKQFSMRKKLGFSGLVKQKQNVKKRQSLPLQ